MIEPCYNTMRYQLMLELPQIFFIQLFTLVILMYCSTLNVLDSNGHVITVHNNIKLMPIYNHCII